MPQGTIEQLITDVRDGKQVSIVDLVNHLLEYAYDMHASDIHIDPLSDMVRVRMRIDGVLQTVFTLPKEVHAEVISRIKVIAGLRIDEHNAAQDGRFRVMLDGQPIDIRVSIAPTYHGENVVLRLLSDRSADFTLERLGFSANDQRKIRKAITKTSGMVLATGPTGSGKTTTLYALLKELNTEEVSIVTIEDPIEYAVDGIRQIQVNTQTNLTFAKGLRSILRQDPNIVMVGEIRDTDTAEIAVNAALTGHLLLSTLHTNDAATTLPRLFDMGVEPYLVASTVNVAIGQRLVRKICEQCRTTHRITDAEAASLSEVLPEGTVHAGMEVTRGQGCERCSGRGYQGRISVNEVLVMNNDIREAILRKASAREIKDIAIKNGMTTMIEDGFEKVRAGVTSIEEVLRVIHE